MRTVRGAPRPGGPRSREARRLLDARRYLYQLLTGADLNDPRHKLAFRTGLDLTRYYEFTDPMTAPLRVALHDHARQILDHLGIDEPITWEPPPDCCGHLAFPGRDPADIDRQAVQQLVIVEEFPVGLTARRLGTSNYHVRFALETMSRPARQWSRSTPPSAWARRQQAPHVLTREFFEREYLNAGKRSVSSRLNPGSAVPLSPSTHAGPVSAWTTTHLQLWTLTRTGCGSSTRIGSAHIQTSLQNSESPL